MPGFILGEKSDQTQAYTEKGERIPVTFVKTSPNFLLDVKESNKHGYWAIKIGFKQTKNIKKPILGQLTKAGIKTPLLFFKEFRLDNFIDQVKFIEENKKKGIALNEKKIFVGEEIQPNLFFKKGDVIDVAGVSKGKGFQGVVRRHHFKGGPRTHGQSHGERAPGAIGQTTTPGRVYRGKRMAGRMGGKRVTIKNLSVLEVRQDGILVKGLIPGPKGGLIEIKQIN